MNNVRDCIALSVLEVEQFLELIDVGMPQENNLDELRSLVAKFLENVPFQNFTMLLGPRRRPTWNEICQERQGDGIRTYRVGVLGNPSRRNHCRG